MKKRRELSELLKIMLDNIHLLRIGLCHLTHILCFEKSLITNEEKTRLIQYITKNRPRKGSKHYIPKRAKAMHYWLPTHAEPRIAWLKDKIKYEKDKEKKLVKAK